jgi:hypothetical protein
MCPEPSRRRIACRIEGPAARGFVVTGFARVVAFRAARVLTAVRVAFRVALDWLALRAPAAFAGGAAFARAVGRLAGVFFLAAFRAARGLGRGALRFFAALALLPLALGAPGARRVGVFDELAAPLLVFLVAMLAILAPLARGRSAPVRRGCGQKTAGPSMSGPISAGLAAESVERRRRRLVVCAARRGSLDRTSLGRRGAPACRTEVASSGHDRTPRRSSRLLPMPHFRGLVSWVFPDWPFVRSRVFVAGRIPRTVDTRIPCFVFHTGTNFGSAWTAPFRRASARSSTGSCEFTISDIGSRPTSFLRIRFSPRNA